MINVLDQVHNFFEKLKLVEKKVSHAAIGSWGQPTTN